MFNKINNFIVTGGGAGYLPRMPGTYGSLVGLALVIAFQALFKEETEVAWLLLSRLTVGRALPSIYLYFLLNFLLTLLAYASIHCAERTDFHHDDPRIVLDEVVGMSWAILALPRIFWIQILGFAFFRLLDIKKPLLIGYIDRNVSGALGTVLDDVLAGIIAYFLIYYLYTLIP